MKQFATRASSGQADAASAGWQSDDTPDEVAYPGWRGGQSAWQHPDEPPPPPEDDWLPAATYEVDESADLLLDGDTFLSLVEADEVPLWGDGDSCLWAPGESLLIAGPTGIGKSTLAHLLVFARLGIIDRVLGYSVTPDERNVLYLAMDRPKQIARAMRRGVDTQIRRVLRDRLIVRRGPTTVPLTDVGEWLLTVCARCNVGTVVIDSIKDMVAKPSDEERANMYNRARQLCLAHDIEWIELHHNRKANGDGKEPRSIDDIYGNRFITAGAGSALYFHGEPSDPIVKLAQLKAPYGEFFPKDVAIDKVHGTMEFYEATSIASILTVAGRAGITTLDIAKQVYGVKAPSKADKERVRRKLQIMADRGAVTRTHGGGTAGDRWHWPTEPTLH